MSRVYIRLLAIAAVLVSAIGASFSVAGLSQLFSGAAKSVALMAAALEFSKLVSTGFLYRYWGHIPHVIRYYLFFAVVSLMAITSMGIFGYLSNAYQKSSFQLNTERLRLEQLQANREAIEKQANDIRDFIAKIPNSRISRKLQFQKDYDPELRALSARAATVTSEMNELRMKLLTTQAEVGPIIYFAQAVHADVDTCVKYLILLFVLVFDPLAVCLIMSWSLAIRLREKYRGNELKISSRSLSIPVDHRKKAA